MPQETKKFATLVNPETSERVAVEVDSQDAQQRFGQGFVLETEAPTGPDAPMATVISPDSGERRAVRTGSPESKTAFSQGFQLEQAPGQPIGAPSTPGASPITSFPDAVRETVNQSVTQTTDRILGAPESYDNTLLNKKAIISQKILDQSSQITPEELRFLSPAEQASIRNGDIAALKTTLSGLNIMQTERKRLRDEERAEAEKVQNRALDRFNTLLQFGAADKMSDADKQEVASALGLANVGALDSIITRNQSTDQFEYELRSGANGTVIEIRKDANTGRVLDTRVLSGDEAAAAAANPVLSTGQPIAVGEKFVSGLGDGVVTAYGSELWAPGLDVQLDGMKNADVNVDFDYRVLRAGEEGGFGNRVRVQRLSDGQEFYFGHLDNIAVQIGQEYAAGTSIGKQGNSGRTIGKTGVHVDITAPDHVNGGYLSPEQVAFEMGIGTGIRRQVAEGETGLLEYDAFLQRLGEGLGQSLDPSSPENQALFQEYQAEATGVTAGTDNTTLSMEDLDELITSTDRKKMVARGMDPNSQADVMSYLQSEYGDSGSGASTTTEDRNPALDAFLSGE